MKRNRIQSIDALRGFVMLLMLVDHTREYFFMHAQISDPIDLSTTSPALFFTRLSAHLCAPIFVFLTGLSAWLYSSRHSLKESSEFLLKRGFFLIFLELTLINFGWTFSFQPKTVYLQVIWAIGLSMVFLAGLIRLPRIALALVSFLIVLGHNVLDPISFGPNEYGFSLWAIIHDRSMIELPWVNLRTSYPVLPWIGAMGLGFVAGPWFSDSQNSKERGKKLVTTGLICFSTFLILRFTNFYGEAQSWRSGSLVYTTMSFLNLTKYPPSANFLLFTLTFGLLGLALLEKIQRGVLSILATFGSVPMFYYILHIYLVHALNILCLHLFGPTQGNLFSVPGVAWLWITSGVLAIPLWFMCKWFGGVKRESNSEILKYF